MTNWRASALLRWQPLHSRLRRGVHERPMGKNPIPTETEPNKDVELTAYSVRSVRRESGMEECGNTLGVQAPNEPLELSIIGHSMV